MDKQYLLTTLDNPYNPFVDFTSWYMFDCEKGHNTSSRLARIANINAEMTQKEREEEMDRVMDLIVKYDLEDLYVKGTEEQIEKWLEIQKNTEKEENVENRENVENVENRENRKNGKNGEKTVENGEKQTATTVNA